MYMFYIWCYVHIILYLFIIYISLHAFILLYRHYIDTSIQKHTKTGKTKMNGGGPVLGATVALATNTCS